MESTREVVVLAHGLYGCPLMMSLLGRRLRREGYATRNWGYLSFVGSVQRHSARLRRLLAELDEDPAVARIHMVTHSMGGIVGWSALSEGVPSKFGRFVLLTPPGRGSWAATAFGWLTHWHCPAIDQMSTRSNSLVNQFRPLDGVEVGVIGATLDTVVLSGYAHMPGEKEYKVFPGLHHQVLIRRDVAQAVRLFLKSGSFEENG